VQLLQPDDYFAEAVTLDDLATYLQHAELVLDDAFEGVPHDGRGLMVEFSIAPGGAARHEVMSDASELPRDVVDSIYERLQALPPLRVQVHEIGFRISFRLTR
jgi:hypothetical protein